MKNNPKFIFIGSTHGFVDDFIKQKEVISSLEPDFVLCEDMENYILDSKSKFENVLKSGKISNMTSFSKVEKLIKLCLEKKIKLIGIDFPNFGFSENLQNKIENKKKLNSSEKLELKNVLNSRIEHHFKKIREFENKTEKALIIILGSWHLRENSLLRKKLQNYKIIALCDEEGKLLMGPKKNIKLEYCEIKSHEN